MKKKNKIANNLSSIYRPSLILWNIFLAVSKNASSTL